MKLNKSLAILALASMPLISQATIMKDSSNDELTKIVYACEKKATLDVVYINTDKGSYAIINQVDEMIPMQNAKSASGAVYKAINPNYNYELITKGKSAQLLVDGKPVLANCMTE